MNGVVSGGWGFVWAAYGISALFLVTYAVHTITDFRKRSSQRSR
jgi:heme exporter protein D